MTPIEHARPTLKLTLLGGFEARAGSGAALRFRTKKIQALVAYLALESDARHLRPKLAALLWGGTRDEQARGSLRHALQDIRGVLRAVSPHTLIVCGDNVAFEPSRIDVDAIRFDQLIGSASQPAVEQAIDLYRGDLLDGFVVDEEPFERWLAERRERLRSRVTKALERHLDAQIDARRVEQAVEVAQRLLGFDCAHEAVHRTLMRLHVEQGRRGAALRQYQLCVDSVQRELGTDPDEETRKLYDSIVRGEFARSATRATRDEQGVRIISRGSDKPCLNALPRHEAPLVGRAEPLGELGCAVDAACRGLGRCVFVIGEAGIGKSRLVAEAALAAHVRTTVLQGLAYESERALPFGLWVDALRSVSAGLEIASGLDPAWRSELARLLPEVAPRKVATYGTSTDERRLFDSILYLLLRLSERAPVVIVLEDLHWADDASARLLAFVARRIGSARILIIATLREEDIEKGSTLRADFSDLVFCSSASKVELRGLSEAHTIELIRRLAYSKDGALTLAKTHASMWETSRGNPFMIVEMVRAMREGTTIQPPGALALSDRVREVVVARIHRMAEPVRSVVAVAALVGREFDFPLIARAAQLSVQDVAVSIEELVRRRILHVIDDCFEFTHAWIREVIYASLLPSRCQLLHGQIALAYEQTGIRNDERLLSTLVHHYSRAKIWNKAAAYARQAGEHALLRCAYTEAATLFENARVALEWLPQDAQIARETIDVRIRLHRSLVPSGIAARMIENLRDVETLLERVDDPSRRAQVLLCVSEHARWTGRYERAVDSGYRALDAAVACADTNLAADARFHLGIAQFSKGRYRTAVSTLRQSVVDAELSMEPSRSALIVPSVIASREFLAYALAWIGQFDEARRVATEAIKIADEIDDPLGQVAARRALGLASVEQGDFDHAVPLLEHALQDCEQSHFDLLFSLIAGGLGYAYALSGRPDEGVPLMQRAVDKRRSLRGDCPGALDACLLTRLGEGCLLARQIAEAAVYAERASELARTNDNPIDEAWSLRLQGDLAARKGPVDVGEAEPLYLRSRAIAAAHEMAPFVAHCDLRIGRLHALLRDDVRSRTALRRARKAFGELRMPYWADRAQQALMRLAHA